RICELKGRVPLFLSCHGLIGASRFGRLATNGKIFELADLRIERQGSSFLVMPRLDRGIQVRAQPCKGMDYPVKPGNDGGRKRLS
ncbi:MAG: hypothetical protein ACLFQR_13540, partial [Desulfovibrionales bacterium]